MQLSSFNGGKSVRLDPSLIQLNEAVVYKNIDNTSGLLKSTKSYTLTDIEVEGYFYKFNNTWLSSSLDRDYIEYQDKLYWTEATSKPKKYDGTTTYNLGIEPPSVKLTTVQSDPVASEKISDDPETLQYVYTYYNSADGTESAPSPISDELSLAADKTVTITGFVASSDIQVDKVRLYRIGADATTLILIVELAHPVTNYIDSIPTLDAPGNVLDSYNNYPPPVDLKYLVEAYGIFFGVKGDKVYFSAVGKPNYWPTSNVIDLSGTGTGLLPIQDGIMLFTAVNISLLVGTTIDTFAVYKASSEQGCNSHKSCKIVKGVPVWSSNEGICSWLAGKPEVFSKSQLGKVALSIKNTCVDDETYYICLTDGSLLAMDMRFGGLAFKDYTFDKSVVNIGKFDNILYAMIDGYVATLFTGDMIEFTYRSPELSEGASSMTKLFNNVYIQASGSFNVRIFIDGKEVLYKDIEGSYITHDIKVPEDKQRGTFIQCLITGIGTIREIEFKPVGRQNGR